MLPAWHRDGSADRVPYADRAGLDVRRGVRGRSDHQVTRVSGVRGGVRAARQSIARIRVISVVCSATTSSAISSIRMLFPCAFTSAAMVMAPSW